VETPTDCPLTVAMNFATTLESRGFHSDGREVELKLYPAYGALTGVWVPASVKKVIIQPRLILPLWSRIAWVMGWLLLAVALFRVVKDDRDAPYKKVDAFVNTHDLYVGRPPA